MKLTNEDLRKIILEEVEKVLKEFHPAVEDPDEDDEKKTMTTNDWATDLIKTAKQLKSDPEDRANIKQGELKIANQIFDEIMRLLRKERDNKTFMTKIKNSMDRLIKAEDK